MEDNKEELVAWTAAQAALLALIRLSNALTVDPRTELRMSYSDGQYRVVGHQGVFSFAISDYDVCAALHSALDILATREKDNG